MNTTFYKYRKIDKPASLRNGCSLQKALQDNPSLDALFKCEAVFSGRRNFTDLFDSKIDLVRPSPAELFNLRSQIYAIKGLDISKFFADRNFTSSGEKFLIDFEIGFSEIIDSYPIYCVSKHCTSNLLWAHYASGHEGFCIEIEFNENNCPKPVVYQKNIYAIGIIEFIKYNCGLVDKENLNERVHKALHVKLEEWYPEEEYRLIGSGLDKGQNFIKIPYNSKKTQGSLCPIIKSVIFGCRMPDHIEQFIMKNIPFRTTFKKAIARKDSIEIESIATLV
jgi:hypothetical protein